MSCIRTYSHSTRRKTHMIQHESWAYVPAWFSNVHVGNAVASKLQVATGRASCFEGLWFFKHDAKCLVQLWFNDSTHIPCIHWVWPPPRMQLKQIKVKLGIPGPKHVIILVVTGIVGGGHTQPTHTHIYIYNYIYIYIYIFAYLFSHTYDLYIICI